MVPCLCLLLATTLSLFSVEMQETGSNLGTSIDTTVVEVKEEYLYLLGIIFSKCVHQKIQATYLTFKSS